MSEPIVEPQFVQDAPRAIRVKTSTGWANLVIQGAPGVPGYPTPVVNGQWLKGVGNAAVWQPIAASDVSGLVTKTQTALAAVNTDVGWAGASAPSLLDEVTPSVGGYSLRSYGAPAAGNGTRLTLRNNGQPFTVLHATTGGSGVPFWLYSYNQPTPSVVVGIGETIEFVYDSQYPYWLQVTRGVAALVTPDQQWRSISSLGYGAGIADYGAPFGPARFRKLASGLVVCDGLIQATSFTGGNGAWTMPVGYRPLATGGGARQLIFGGASSVSPAPSELWRIAETGGVSLMASGSPWVSTASIHYYADG
jgi:hypothetical protein